MATGVSFSPPNPATDPGRTVAAGAFWPAIDLNHFRDVMRIGGTTLTDARLIDALEGAILAIATELMAWQTARIADGYAILSAVPSPRLGGDTAPTALMILWRRAVCAWATADLMETHRDITATAAGAARADVLVLTSDDHRRNATHAVRDILGTTRTCVALI